MPVLEAALTHALVSALHAPSEWRRSCAAFLKAVESLPAVQGSALWLHTYLVDAAPHALGTFMLHANHTGHAGLHTTLEDGHPAVERMKLDAPLVVSHGDPLAADLGVAMAVDAAASALVIFKVGTAGWLAVEVDTAEAARAAVVPGGLEAVATVFGATMEYARAPLQTRTRQVKEQFLANMSHEMRTPLNVIQGMTHLLLQDDVTDEQQRQIRTIHAAADDLLQRINQVLSYAQLEAGDLVYATKPFGLRSLMGDMEKRFRRLIEGKGGEVQFVLHIEADVPHAVVGDAQRLKQVLHQLLSNTVKFTERGRICLSVSYRAPSTVRVEISDTGVGIAAEQLPHVFAPFVQAESDDDRTYGGVGLGLSMARTLVEGMNGTIEVESAVGEGTTCILRVPLPVATESVLPGTSANTLDHKRRVLVVDDNLLNQEVVRRMLERWGVTVLTASSGAEALETLADSQVGAVLMDLQMPGMDGYTTAQSIRSRPGASRDELPIIAVTASTLGRRHRKLADVGINAYLAKPFGPEELWRCLHPYLHIDRTIEPDDPVAGSGASYRHIDLAHMRDNAFGSTNFLRKVLDICLEQLPAFIEQLDEARTKSDWESVAFVVHKLKSTTSTVGAEALTQRLQDIEAQIKDPDADPDPEELRTQLADILGEVRGVLYELERERRTYA